MVGFDGCLVTSPPPPAAAAASISPAIVVTPYGLTERLHICPEFLRGQCSVELCPFAHPGAFLQAYMYCENLWCELDSVCE